MRASRGKRELDLRVDKRAGLVALALLFFLLLTGAVPLIAAPVVVDVSSSIEASALGYQRKLLRDSDYYFWTFYFDGTNTCYERSDDTSGASWTGAHELFSAGNVQPSVWQNSDTLYVAFSIAGDILVRRGVISGGTIAWSSPSTALLGSATTTYVAATICQDENGFLWVAARAESLSNYYVCAARSVSPRDETSWQAAQTISPASPSSSLYALILPLKNGDVYVVWQARGSIRGKRYVDGTGWEATDTAIAAGFPGNPQKLFSAVSEGGRVHLLYVSQSGRVCYKRYEGTTWGNEQVLNNRTDSACPSISINPSNFRIYALWSENTRKKLMCKSAILPTVSTDWRLDFTAQERDPAVYFTSCYSSTSRICWLYTKDTGAAPYDLVLDGTAVRRISIQVSKSAFAFGTQPPNAWLAAESTLVTNDGDWPVNIYGKLSGFVSGAFAWTISGTSNGPDMCRAQWSTVSDTGPWNNVVAYGSEFLIMSNLQVTNPTTLYFRIQTPTSTSSYNEYASNFVVRAQDY